MAPKQAPSPQDEAVNADKPPKFAKLTDLAVDQLVQAAYEALSQNRPIEAYTADGRQWEFRPDSSDGATQLRLSCAWVGPNGLEPLATNRLLTSYLQTEGGPELVRSAIGIMASTPR